VHRLHSSTVRQRAVQYAQSAIEHVFLDVTLGGIYTSLPSSACVHALFTRSRMNFVRHTAHNTNGHGKVQGEESATHRPSSCSSLPVQVAGIYPKILKTERSHCRTMRMHAWPRIVLRTCPSHGAQIIPHMIPRWKLPFRRERRIPAGPYLGASMLHTSDVLLVSHLVPRDVWGTLQVHQLVCNDHSKTLSRQRKFWILGQRTIVLIII